MEDNYWLIKLVKHPAWDVFPLVALFGAYAVTGEENWVAGIGVVLWFFTLIVRFSSKKK
jgi:hypothetical protein